jgi:hypothetical protein
MFKFIFSVLTSCAIYILFLSEITLTNEQIGLFFTAAIMACFLIFLFFKVGVHYCIASLESFATAFYYAVFEYKKIQKHSSNLTYQQSVREQAEVALAANFDPSLSTSELKIPVSLYTGKDPFLKELREKIIKAGNLKLNARSLENQANVLLDKTQGDLGERKLIINN